jgi:AraC-like DNA-binding protein
MLNSASHHSKTGLASVSRGFENIHHDGAFDRDLTVFVMAGELCVQGSEIAAPLLPGDVAQLRRGHHYQLRSKAAVDWLCVSHGNGRPAGSDHTTRIGSRNAALLTAVRSAHCVDGTDLAGIAHRIAISAPQAQPAPRWLHQARCHMINAIGESHAITKVARQTNVSASTLERGFKASLGCSPHSHFISLRLRFAEHLLAWSELPVADVAAQCGFADRSCLSGPFHHTFGLRPSDYRQWWQL